MGTAHDRVGAYAAAVHRLPLRGLEHWKIDFIRLIDAEALWVGSTDGRLGRRQGNHGVAPHEPCPAKCRRRLEEMAWRVRRVPHARHHLQDPLGLLPGSPEDRNVHLQRDGLREREQSEQGRLASKPAGSDPERHRMPREVGVAERLGRRLVVRAARHGGHRHAKRRFDKRQQLGVGAARHAAPAELPPDGDRVTQTRPEMFE